MNRLSCLIALLAMCLPSIALAKSSDFIPNHVDLTGSKIAGTVKKIEGPGLIKVHTMQNNQVVYYWVRPAYVDFAEFKNKACVKEKFWDRIFRDKVYNDLEGFEQQVWFRCNILKKKLLDRDIFVDITKPPSPNDVRPVFEGYIIVNDNDIVNYDLISEGYYRADRSKLHDKALMIKEKEAYCSRKGLWAFVENETIALRKCQE